MPWPEKLVTPVLACLAALSFPVAQGADHPPAQKPAVTDAAPANSAIHAPMVTPNPDGTFTVRKEPANGVPRVSVGGPEPSHRGSPRQQRLAS
jgi:hypothetical protein